MENSQKEVYDLIIVGGGPAGASAAIYAARKKLKSLLILKEWGGQSVDSTNIENWIGTPHLTGLELAKKLQEHVETYAEPILEIKTGALVKSAVTLTLDNKKYIQVALANGESLTARALLIATGSNRRKLDVPGATEFENKGISYCASCDGPMFSGMDVVVIGGGNAGFDSAAQLLAYTKSVTLLSRSEPRADPVTVEKLLEDPKFKLVKNVIPKKITGETFVSSLTYADKNTQEEMELKTSGIFVEVGQIPSTDWVKEIVDLDLEKKIKINPWTNRTLQNGKEQSLIWAAGDVTNILYQQNNIASGEAVKAVEDIYKTLKTR